MNKKTPLQGTPPRTGGLGNAKSTFLEEAKTPLRGTPPRTRGLGNPKSKFVDEKMPLRGTPPRTRGLGECIPWSLVPGSGLHKSILDIQTRIIRKISLRIFLEGSNPLTWGFKIRFVSKQVYFFRGKTPPRGTPPRTRGLGGAPGPKEAQDGPWVPP